MTLASGDIKLSSALAEYGRHHKNARNKRIHLLCIPAIVFSVIGLLFAVNFGIVLIAIAAAILYYSRFGQRTAIQMGAILIVMLGLWMTLMPSYHLVLVALSIFVLAWTGQFAGHIYEGSKPSFFEDIQSLLIGPVYVLAELKAKFARDPGRHPR